MGKTVSGVKLNLVKDGILTKYCAKYGVVRTGSIADDVALLVAKVRSKVAKAKLADCDVCGGDSSVDDDECPYCGEGGIELVDAPVVTPAVVAPIPPAVEPVVVTTASIESVKKPRGRPKGVTAAKLEAVREIVEIPAEQPVEEPTSDIAPIVEPSVEIVSSGEEEYPIVATEPHVSSLTIGDAIAEVREAKRLAVICYWQFGAAILKCFRGDLWKQCRDDTGQPKYTGFNQFCEGELSLSGRYCYTLMDIAATFSSDDVAEIGVAKLGIMVRLPEPQRVKLLDDVRKGMPYSELSAEVKKQRDSGLTRDSGDNRTSKATAAARAKASVRETSVLENVITCTHDVTRSRIPLFVRADTGVDSTKHQPKRATRLADDPWGEEISSNGITLRYSLTMDGEGKLVLVVERRRVD